MPAGASLAGNRVSAWPGSSRWRFAMRFNLQFAANQTSEWKSKYVDYDYLRKLLKTAQQRADGDETPLLLKEAGVTEEDVGNVYNEFEKLLDLELEKVCEFYHFKFSQYNERFLLLERQIQQWKQVQKGSETSMWRSLSSGVLGRTPSGHEATQMTAPVDATDDEDPSAAGELVFVDSDGEELIETMESDSPDEPAPRRRRSSVPLIGQTWTSMQIKKRGSLLKKSLSQLYRALLMLRNYALLNRTALVKLQRHYDDCYSKNDLFVSLEETFGARLTDSVINNAEDVKSLLKTVEELFSHTFNNGKSAKGLLRERKHDTEDLDLYMIGFFVGMSLPLMLLWVVNVTVTLFSLPEELFLALIPLFRLVWVPAVGLWMWGLDIYVWHKARINHVFIFNFNPDTAQGYRQAFVFAGLIFALFWSFLYLDYNRVVSTSTFSYIPEEIGLWFYSTLLLVLVAFVVFFPFDFFYRSSRACFARTSLSVFVSPFGAVRFREFFLGDVYTSLVKTMFDCEYTICYYVTGDFLQEDSYTCQTVNSYMLPFFSCLPLWWRMAQCLRRYYYTRRTQMLFNALKYACGFSVVFFSSVNGNFQQYEPGYWPISRILWLCSFICSTLYMYCWDVFMDWGLGRVKSKNFLLRDQLVWKDQKWFYFYCIVSDFILRFFWTLTISPFAVELGMQTEMLNLVAATLEIIRRFTWAILRVENEHLNNVGQFRAVDFIPLPFDINMTEEPEVFAAEVPQIRVESDHRIHSPVSAMPLARGLKQRNISMSWEADRGRPRSLSRGEQHLDGNESLVVHGLSSHATGQD